MWYVRLPVASHAAKPARMAPIAPSPAFAPLAAAGYHSCGLRADGVAGDAARVREALWALVSRPDAKNPG